ncbi:MAG: hypothetical protein M0D57_08905 [Sphingobacteriales bacterium JAD_PAG50586_3]|nr:MAG: hypothetical protein M0D57_08905 [Sphingobacteriales bacterium JAD_PAG50586_3]
MKRLLPKLLAILVFFTAFAILEKPAIRDAKWMLGKWENVSANGTLIEALAKTKRHCIHRLQSFYYG